MIVYCDTSALIKLFVHEAHSETARQTCLAASHVVVSQLAWVEVCAGLALKKRTGQIEAHLGELAWAECQSTWSRYQKISVDTTLIVEAGHLAQRLGLRAYDSVQLAAARRVHQRVGTALTFLCFDKQLNTAAMALGLNVLSF